MMMIIIIIIIIIIILPSSILTSLQVNFPIVITQLGVFDSDSDGLENGLTIRLYDRISQVSILNTIR